MRGLTTTPPVRVPIAVRPSRIDGRGVFATARIPARRKLGELGGELIAQREARRRARRRRRIAIVELDGRVALDASVGGTALRYVNHSCQPNAFIRIIGKHVEFYALRSIRAGEEITCNYGETQHEGTLPCKCGLPGCCGFL
jgi:SET domain-containing protein